jgi:hypothetical protein
MTRNEIRFVWNTGSTRLRVAVVCWTLGLHRVAARLAKAD